MKIEIVGDKVVNSGIFGMSSFVQYEIRTTYPKTESSPELHLTAERRYKDFEWLHAYLQTKSEYKGLIFPELPAKKAVGSMDPGFIQQRRLDLERYLNYYARHEKLWSEPTLKIFLGDTSQGRFEDLRDRYPMNSIDFTQLDLSKMSGAYEYAFASLKTKLKKHELNVSLKKENNILE